MAALCRVTDAEVLIGSKDKTAALYTALLDQGNACPGQDTSRVRCPHSYFGHPRATDDRSAARCVGARMLARVSPYLVQPRSRSSLRVLGGGKVDSCAAGQLLTAAAC